VGELITRLKRPALRLPTWLSRGVIDDVCLTAIAALVATLMMRVPPSILEPHGGATLVGQLALAGCLLFRRRWPVLVLWIITLAAAAIALVEALAPGSLVPPDLGPTQLPWISPAAPFAVYSALVFGRDRRLVWPAVLLLAVLCAHAWDVPADSPWFLQSLVFIGGPALLGMYSAARQRLLRSLVDRAERAEREQSLLTERVLAQERSRVAGEMHDVVTHRVSLMVLQAGALRISSADDAVRRAAEELRMTGCRALEELRDLVGLLHGTSVGVIGATGPGQSTSPAQPDVDDLAALVDESRSVGVQVELVEEGSPAQVAPVVARTAHRVVQEALTNVRKHAPGARAEVRVRYGPDGVRVTVRNTAATRQVDSGLITAGSGTGLSGLRQRIELIKGSLAAGPTQDPADPGFQVEATLPAYVATSAPVTAS
jgi:signal transduction histidine kinase